MGFRLKRGAGLLAKRRLALLALVAIAATALALSLRRGVPGAAAPAAALRVAELDAAGAADVLQFLARRQKANKLRGEADDVAPIVAAVASALVPHVYNVGYWMAAEESRAGGAQVTSLRPRARTA